jgi:hypothetical protein
VPRQLMMGSTPMDWKIFGLGVFESAAVAASALPASVADEDRKEFGRRALPAKGKSIKLLMWSLRFIMGFVLCLR